MFLQAAVSTINFNQLNTVTVGDVVFNFVKIMFLIGFFLYILFAFLAIRQIEEMRQTVVTPLSPVIRVAGYLHLLLAIGVFLFVFTFLS
jgi:hypothetical protein